MIIDSNNHHCIYNWDSDEYVFDYDNCIPSLPLSLPTENAQMDLNFYVIQFSK